MATATDYWESWGDGRIENKNMNIYLYYNRVSLYYTIKDDQNNEWRGTN